MKLSWVKITCRFICEYVKIVLLPGDLDLPDDLISVACLQYWFSKMKLTKTQLFNPLGQHILEQQIMIYSRTPKERFINKDLELLWTHLWKKMHITVSNQSINYLGYKIYYQLSTNYLGYKIYLFGIQNFIMQTSRTQLLHLYHKK